MIEIKATVAGNDPVFSDNAILNPLNPRLLGVTVIDAA
jgi:hypothetical protein